MRTSLTVITYTPCTTPKKQARFTRPNTARSTRKPAERRPAYIEGPAARMPGPTEPEGRVLGARVAVEVEAEHRHAVRHRYACNS